MNMDRVSISAKIIADSIHQGNRLTTFELTFPRFILAEFNTHRVISRNSASSRAIPVWKRLAELVLFPFVPLQFGKNKAGMQSAEEASEEDNESAKKLWLMGRDFAVVQAYMLAGGESQIMKDAKGNPEAEEVCRRLNDWVKTFKRVMPDLMPLSSAAHKQHANRVLEPYARHTVIATGTHWRNFFALRASKMAQPEIKDLAVLMAKAMMNSHPVRLEEGEWHLPYIFDEDRREVSDQEILARISSGRSARVSYLTHDGKRALDADIKMADGLQGNGHASPFEHPAMASSKGREAVYKSNFGFPWIQYRKMLNNEGDFSSVISRSEFLEGMNGDEALVDFVLGLPR